MSFRKFSGTNTRVITPAGIGEDGGSDSTDGESDGLRVAVTPAPGSVIKERRPRIEADLSRCEGEILPDSILLKMSGFGQCAAEFDPENRVVSYRPRMAIRRRVTEVTLSFKRDGEKKEDVVGWQFEIDLTGTYFPQSAGRGKSGESDRALKNER